MVRLLIVALLFAAAPALAQNDGVTDPPRYHHEDDPEDAYLDHAPLHALVIAEIDAAHQACMEEADELQLAIECQAETHRKYLETLDEVRAELRAVLTPSQQEAFDASETAWQRYVNAEKAFLSGYWGEFNPEWGQLMQKESLLEMYRFRLETLDQIPRD